MYLCEHKLRPTCSHLRRHGTRVEYLPTYTVATMLNVEIVTPVTDSPSTGPTCHWTATHRYASLRPSAVASCLRCEGKRRVFLLATENCATRHRIEWGVFYEEVSALHPCRVLSNLSSNEPITYQTNAPVQPATLPDRHSPPIRCTPRRSSLIKWAHGKHAEPLVHPRHLSLICHVVVLLVPRVTRRPGRGSVHVVPRHA